jgi:threonyl-tRNA synthetase
VYRSRGRSFRDLPLRIAELGGMYRAERSGVLSGLSRVRAMSLNDAHIFCTADRIRDEVALVLAMMRRAHRALGVVPARVRLSLRGEGKGYAGDPADWDRAEAVLRDALSGSSYVEAAGEAAFYGPKIDVQLVDPAGREWTLATVQVDFHQPSRFDLSYVDSSGRPARPVMVHRSLVGSMERLFGHLIEVHAGAFPAWYAPVQLVVLPIGQAELAAARGFEQAAAEAGLRVELSADGSLGARVREWRRAPFLAVIGSREAAAGAVSLRVRDAEVADVPVPVAQALRVVVEAGAMP